ncbi:MAG: alpha/beta hydrolase [Candidatus Limnocylindrales bacterium]
MHREIVEFYSRGSKIVGTLHRPAGGAGPLPAIVQGPGWLGLRDAKLYERYHDACLEAGFAVLVFDHRGFGDSEGDSTFLDPRAQVDDYRAAASYLETRPDIDPSRLGVFGSGATGGGNAVMAAAADARFKAVVSQVPIADGRDWLHRMRREHEWLEFLERVQEDRRKRARGGTGTMVAPRDGIMVPTPERRTTTIKADVDDRVPREVQLASVEAIFDYRPIDHVQRIAPRAVLFIAVEHDATTPEDHARALYDRAGGPKRLILQTGTTHYAAYAQYGQVIAPLIADWFRRFVVSGDLQVTDAEAESSVTYLRGDP